MAKFKKSIFSIIATICLISGIMTPVMAEEQKTTSLLVSPPNQEIVLIPGETFEGTIRVANPNESAIDLKYSVSIGSFSQKQGDNSNDDYGAVDTQTVTSYNQMMDWIVLKKESGTVAPNEFDIVPFSIIVPENAPAGGQYATIMVQNDTEQNNSGGNVMIEDKTRIAAIVYAEVAGETREEGVILENNIPSFLLNNQLETVSMVQNSGNVHTDASYVLQVWSLFSDEEICTNEEEPATSLIMPETSKYHTETCNLPSVGIFKAKQTVSIFGETSIVEKTIIVCPLWLLFLIIFAVVAIIFWLIMKAHSRKSSKSRKASAE